MKKRAFTLAEILICIGIIGVVASTMLPIVSKFKPDENKVRYLSTYKALTEIVPVLANNKSAFPMTNAYKPTVYYDYPLLNLDAPFVLDGTEYTGAAKFCRMLAASLNTSGAISCSANYDSSASPSFTPSFETVNGIQYMVQTNATLDEDSGEGSYQSDIFIDVDGAAGSNCFATSESCKKPDRFKFLVAADGHVVAADKLGEEYLKTRASWKLNRDKQPFGTMIAKLPDNELNLVLEKIPVELPPEPEVPDNSNDDSDANPGKVDIKVDLGDDDEDVIMTSKPDPEAACYKTTKTWATNDGGGRYTFAVASPQPTPNKLRTTNASCVYCECHNPSMPPGNYSNQRHYWYNANTGNWMEVVGVYSISSSDLAFPRYNKSDCGDIIVWNSWGE